jgi:hypothetical protein
MPKPIVPSDQFLSLPFPIQGINNSTGYQQQPANTTPTASNVRAYDAVQLRNAGGSRPGLLSYVAGQASGNNVIQALGTVVWVSSSAVGT